MDKLTLAQRHKNMAAIHGKNTKPEMIVRRGLWSRGFRYRLNHRGLPGHPDLVLRKYRTCIFVNGCFWHGHNVDVSFLDYARNDKVVNSDDKVVNSDDMVVNSECCKISKTNREFWVAKIRRNKERDIEDQKKLAEMGWHCITIWECDLKPSKREETLKSLVYTLNKIWLEDHRVKTGPYPEIEDEMLKAAEE